MVSITLSVPEETRKMMKDNPEINWSGFVRQCIIDKAKRIVLKKELLKQLEDEKEYDELSIQLGNKIKQGMEKRYRKN